MKFKKDYFVISYELYPFDILISSQNKRELRKTLKRVLPKNYEAVIEIFDQGSYKARTEFSNHGQTIIHFKQLSHGIIAHEVYHSVCMLFEHIGIRYSQDSEEAFAYTIQYLTDEIYRMIEQ